MASFYCKLNWIGPSSDGSETASPVIYLLLSDEGGAFSNQWFYAAQNAKNEILATALCALSNGFRLAVEVVPPNTGNSPYTELSRLTLIAGA